MLEVAEVASGLACSCVCPACNQPLLARKGKKNIHHFAHYSSDGAQSCTGALETSVHRMAKQIIDEDKSLLLPELIIERSAEDKFGITHSEEIGIEDSGTRVFERVDLERRLDEIRPDIIGYIDESPLLIEIAVTSFVGKEKKGLIQKLCLPAIEIDLHSADYATTKEELRGLLNSESTKKEWLSNPKAIEAKKLLKSRLDDKIRHINEVESQRVKDPLDLSTTSIRSSSPTDSSSVPRRDFPFEGHGETRWFYCESCTAVFELPVSVAPASIPMVTCPGCSSSVSAARHRTSI